MKNIGEALALPSLLVFSGVYGVIRQLWKANLYKVIFDYFLKIQTDETDKPICLKKLIAWLNEISG